MLEYTGIALAAGVLLDLLLGDPAWIPHPVVFIGKWISCCEKLLRRIFPDSPRGLVAAGICLVILVCLPACAIPWLILLVAFRIHMVLGIVVMSLLCWQMLAAKSLREESMNVYHALREGTLEDSRTAASRIVGRDTQALDETGVTKAAVETVAENFSDGVLAPMLYMAVGGPVFLYLYKAINTMDSMVGYKNAKYLYFGCAAAKVDDAANYIPARLAALVLIAAAGLLRMDVRGSWRIWRRDRRNHASPNSAQTESAAAGAMGIQLAGNAYYFGELYEKPTIGDPVHPVMPEHIVEMNKLMYAATILSAILCVAADLAVWMMIL